MIKENEERPTAPLGFEITPEPSPAELSAIIAALRLRASSNHPPSPSAPKLWLLAARREGLRSQPTGWAAAGWLRLTRIGF
jgi:hypothetical protein